MVWVCMVSRVSVSRVLVIRLIGFWLVFCVGRVRKVCVGRIKAKFSRRYSETCTHPCCRLDLCVHEVVHEDVHEDMHDDMYEDVQASQRLAMLRPFSADVHVNLHLKDMHVFSFIRHYYQNCLNI